MIREKVKMMMFSDCFAQGLLVGLLLQLHVHLLGMDGLQVLWKQRVGDCDQGGGEHDDQGLQVLGLQGGSQCD